jgi:hypothetical protein
VRDSIFYGASIVLFIVFAWDGYFEWWEGFIEILLYLLYIYCMKRNQDMKGWLLNTFDTNNQVAPLVSPTMSPRRIVHTIRLPPLPVGARARMSTRALTKSTHHPPAPSPSSFASFCD